METGILRKIRRWSQKSPPNAPHRLHMPPSEMHAPGFINEKGGHTSDSLVCSGFEGDDVRAEARGVLGLFPRRGLKHALSPAFCLSFRSQAETQL